MTESLEHPNRDLAGLDPRLVEKWLLLRDWADRRGCPIFMTEGRRSRARQAWLYAQGRTRPGPIVTHAQPGQSNHEPAANGYGCAIDFAFLPRGEAGPWDEAHPWAEVGAQAELLGLEWGGRWRTPDRPHLQLPKS